MKTIGAFLAFCVLLFACTKETSLEGGELKPIEDPGWEFKDSGVLFEGSIDTAVITQQGQLEGIAMQGISSDGTGQLYLQIIGDAPLEPGTFNSEQVIFEYYVGGVLFYTSLTGAPTNFTLTVTGLDSVSVTGTFSGDVVDASGNTRNITDGKFEANLSGVDIEGGQGDIDCGSIHVNGQYIVNTPVDVNNTIELTVNVTTPGPYTISTAEVNGVTFSTTGEFTATGPATVVLVGSGTPVNRGTIGYNVSLGQSSCVFSLNVLDDNTDTLQEGPPGTLAAEMRSLGANATDSMRYNSSNQIAVIQSDVYPLRRIFYNSNNKLDVIEHYVPDGTGGYIQEGTRKYEYDALGNVINIHSIDNSGNIIDTVLSFSYNAENKVQSKISFENGNRSSYYRYQYNAGNLTTMFQYDVTGTSKLDSVAIEYDTRQNNFTTIHTQYYFLDMANVFDYTDTQEIFYYSTNYPVKLIASNGTETQIEVIINPNFKPIEVKVNNITAFKYAYN
jgi:hypothetical protein